MVGYRTGQQIASVHERHGIKRTPIEGLPPADNGDNPWVIEQPDDLRLALEVIQVGGKLPIVAEQLNLQRALQRFIGRLVDFP